MKVHIENLVNLNEANLPKFPHEPKEVHLWDHEILNATCLLYIDAFKK